VPQTRDGSFSTEIFERYQRSERAFVLGLMEMYVKAAERADALRTQAYQRRQSVGDDVEAMVLGSLPVTNFRNQQAAIV
jgi:transposase-like protein